jgi:hypothetical protein
MNLWVRVGRRAPSAGTAACASIAAVAAGCRRREEWANSGLSHRKMSRRDRKRPGGFAMRIDLKKVHAEMTDLRSKLAAIDNDLDECRRRHFEHSWTRSQIRRGRTFERHRVQRRLEEFAFARKCPGGRPLWPRVMLSFRSLASPGERTTEGVEHLQQAHDRCRHRLGKCDSTKKSRARTWSARLDLLR